MLASMKQAGQLSLRRPRSQHDRLLLLKVAMTSMVSMGILIGTYFIPQASYLVVLPWLVFAVTATYVTKEFFLSVRSKRRLRHCLDDIQESKVAAFDKGKKNVSMKV